MTSLRSMLRSPMTWVLVLVVIAAIVVIAGAGDDVADIAGETAPVEVAGAPLAPMAEPDSTVGSPIPTVTASLMDGGTIVLEPGGPARMIAFFAHWCPHCQAEVPVAMDWLENTDLPAGLEVLAVSTAVDSSADNYPPSDWLEGADWPTPVLLDDADRTLADAFGLTSFPFWVAVDADGNVAARMSGSLNATQLDELAALATGGQPVN